MRRDKWGVDGVLLVVGLCFVFGRKNFAQKVTSLDTSPKPPLVALFHSKCWQVDWMVPLLSISAKWKSSLTKPCSLASVSALAPVLPVKVFSREGASIEGKDPAAKWFRFWWHEFGYCNHCMASVCHGVKYSTWHILWLKRIGVCYARSKLLELSASQWILKLNWVPFLLCYCLSHSHLAQPLEAEWIKASWWNVSKHNKTQTKPHQITSGKSKHIKPHHVT